MRSLVLLASTYLVAAPEGRAVVMRLKRYAVAFHAVVIKSERHDTNLDDLVAADLLLPGEARQLAALAGMREYTLVTWMSRCLAQAAQTNLLIEPRVSLPLLQNGVMALRSAGGLCGMFTASQLPFPYLQLLTVIVKMNLVIIALQYGQESGMNYSKGWLP